MTTDNTMAPEAGTPAAPGAAAAPAISSSPAPAGFDFSTVPEKHRVFKQDGTFDAETTLTRIDRQRAELERRMGSVGERRPDAPADYKFEVAPEIAPLFEAMGEDAINGFREEAHANGLTETQANWAVARHLEGLAAFGAVAPQVDVKQATAELRKEWTTDEQFNDNVRSARNALAAFGGDEAKAIMDKHGNDPSLIKMFARMGAELGPGRAPSPPGSHTSTGGSAQDFLKANYAAYADSKHPDNARVTAEFNRRNKAEVGWSGDHPAL